MFFVLVLMMSLSVSAWCDALKNGDLWGDNIGFHCQNVEVLTTDVINEYECKVACVNEGASCCTYLKSTDTSGTCYTGSTPFSSSSNTNWYAGICDGVVSFVRPDKDTCNGVNYALESWEQGGIWCNPGDGTADYCAIPGQDYSDRDCIVDEAQTVYFARDDDVTEAKIFKFNKLEIQENLQISSDVWYTPNTHGGSNTDCDHMEGRHGGTPNPSQLVGGIGGAGGMAGDSEGGECGEPGGGGGAGGTTAYRGGRGGAGYGWNYGGWSNPAGGNVKFITQEFILLSGVVLSANGEDGNNGHEASNGDQGGGGGAGGSGGGIIHISTVSLVLNGNIKANGGDGAKGGNDFSGGGGGGGGAGARGYVSFTAPIEEEDFCLKVQAVAGSEGEPGTSSGPNQVWQAEDGYSSEDIGEEVCAKTKITETDPEGLEENSVIYCQDGLDNDFDGLIDMQDGDCYNCTADSLTCGSSFDNTGQCPSQTFTDPLQFENLELEQFSATNTDDGCCGDDGFKCVPINFGMDPLTLSYCNDIYNKHDCLWESDYKCDWHKSDIGSIYNDVLGNNMCFNEYGLSPGWVTKSASTNEYVVREIKIGDKVVHVTNTNDNVYLAKWAVCDAYFGNLLDVDEEYLVYGRQSFDSGDSGLYYMNESFRCFGYNFAREFNDSHSEWAKCVSTENPLGTGEKAYGDTLYEIDLINSVFNEVAPHSILGGPHEIYPLQGALHGTPSPIIDVMNYPVMRFDMRSETPLSEVKLYWVEDPLSGVSLNFEKILDKEYGMGDEDWNHYVAHIDGDYPDVYKIAFFPTFPGTASVEMEIANVRFEEAFVSNPPNPPETYYCTNHDDINYWVNDLDSIHGEEACDKQEAFSWTELSCCGDDTTQSEKEFYTYFSEENDINVSCFSGISVKNNSRLGDSSGFGEDKGILFFTNSIDNGFYSCQNELVVPSNIFSEGEPNNNNVESKEVCDYVGSYVCLDGNHSWKNMNESGNDGGLFDNILAPEIEIDDFEVSSSPDETSQQCCPNMGCWDGEVCQPEYFPIPTTDLICINHNWVNIEENKNWNPTETEFNFCEEEEWCFVNVGYRNLNSEPNWDKDEINDEDDECLHSPWGASVSPTGCAPGEIPGESIVHKDGIGEEVNAKEGFCVPDGYTVENSTAFCYKGNWSTRTALIAATMKNYTEEHDIEDYTISCGQDDFGIDLIGVLNYHTDNYGSTSEFCVLRYGEGEEEERIVGAPIITSDTVDHPEDFLSGIGAVGNKAACNGVPLGNEFAPCSDSESDIDMWYNSHYDLFLLTNYNEGAFNPLSGGDFWSVLYKMILDPIQWVVNLINGNPGGGTIFGGSAEPVVLPVVNFDRLYISKVSDKEILAYVRDNNPTVLNGVGTVQSGNYAEGDLLSINYKNIGFDVCEYVDQFRMPNYLSNVATDIVPNRLFCDFTIDSNNDINFHVVSADQYGNFLYSTIFLWRDLTSEIRLDSVSSSLALVNFNIEGTPSTTANDIVFDAVTFGDIPNSLDYKWELYSIYPGNSLVQNIWEPPNSDSVTVDFSSPDISTYYQYSSPITFYMKLNALGTYSNGTVFNKTIIKPIRIHVPPTVDTYPQPYIVPENPTLLDTLTAVYTFRDIDEDEEDKEDTVIKWYLEVEGGEGILMYDGGTGISKTYDPEQLGTYYFVVTPKDEYQTGAEYESEHVIVENVCGDGFLDLTEECEENNIPETCVSIGQGFLSGSLACDSYCNFDTTGCYNSECNNGVLDVGEDCDGGLGCTNCVCDSGYYSADPSAIGCLVCEGEGNSCSSDNECCGLGCNSDGFCGEEQLRCDLPAMYNSCDTYEVLLEENVNSDEDCMDLCNEYSAWGSDWDCCTLFYADCYAGKGFIDYNSQLFLASECDPSI
ncbi:hypothetical protein N9934_01880 [Desulfosarcina sp.]|nr:hypothetical protein [Desulfosarcina sp.]